MNDLLQQLEDKVIGLVDELEASREKARGLIRENQDLQSQVHSVSERSNTEQSKLESILSLLDDAEPSSSESVGESNQADHAKVTA